MTLPDEIARLRELWKPTTVTSVVSEPVARKTVLAALDALEELDEGIQQHINAGVACWGDLRHRAAAKLAGGGDG